MDFKYVLSRVLIGVLIILIATFIKDITVNAETITADTVDDVLNFDDYILPGDAYSCTSPDVSLTGTFSCSQSSMIQGTLGANVVGGEDIGFYRWNDITFNLTSGNIVNFYLGDDLTPQKDHYYVLELLVGNGNNNTFNWLNFNNMIGFVQHPQEGTSSTYDWVTQAGYYSTTYALTEDYYVTKLTIKFKQSTVISTMDQLVFNFQNMSSFDTQDLIFYGYKFTDVGDDNSIISTEPTSSISTSSTSSTTTTTTTHNYGEDIYDSMTDSNVDTDDFGDIGNNIPENGVLSSILTMPIQFFQTLLNVLSLTSCPNIEFTIPWVDYEVVIPCPRELLDDLGALVFYEAIGGLVGGILLFQYVIFVGKEVEKMTHLKETNMNWGGF